MSLNDPRSITDILLALGYRHESIGREPSHRIICLETGEAIGWHTADKAVPAAEAHKARRQAPE